MREESVWVCTSLSPVIITKTLDCIINFYRSLGHGWTREIQYFTPIVLLPGSRLYNG